MQTNALQSVSEKAHGVKYTESLKTGWVPPNHVRNMTAERAEVRKTKLMSASQRLLSLYSLLYDTGKGVITILRMRRS